MKHVLALLLLCNLLLLCTGCTGNQNKVPDGEIIRWVDPVIEQSVRIELQKPEGDIYTSEIGALQIITVMDKGIQWNHGTFHYLGAVTDLSDLAHFRNSIGLILSKSSVDDLSILTKLPNLQQLMIFQCPNITDLSPLEGLPNLVDLLLNENPNLLDFEPIRTLPNLIKLDLRGCGLTSFDFAGIFPKLRTLRMDLNRISDVGIFKELSGLQELDLHGNRIADISPLAGMEKLYTLRLDNNRIEDVSPLSALTKLTYLDLSTNKITDIQALSCLTAMEYLNLARNDISDISALSDMRALRKLYLQETSVSDTGLISGSFRNLEYLNIAKTNVTTILPLQNIPTLKELNISGLSVGTLEIETIKKKLKFCQVIDA